MAEMYPKNIELYNATFSEKLVYKALQEQLPDTYTFFYSVQWVDTHNNKKIESECDFLIFNEQEGFLTCEVKGGRGYRKDGPCFILEENDGERILRRSPMEQSEESSRFFYNLYSKAYNDKFKGTYGSISLFPFYNVDDPVLMDHRPRDIVFDIRDMDDLYRRIKKAFAFYRPTSSVHGALTRAQKDNFKNLINKRIAVQAAAGAIIQSKELELANLNRIQDNFVYFLNNYSKTFITGGAGTGKTWIAYKFARKAALSGKRVLVTTFNKQLSIMFHDLLAGYKGVSILSFEELVSRDGVQYIDNSEQLLKNYDGISTTLYDTVIVDEAQDFDRNQALIIIKHLIDNKEAELRVFYDHTQNILNKDFKDGFMIDNPPFILRENLRNTASIHDWATERTNLGKDIITNQIVGPIPLSYKFVKDYEAKKHIETEILKLVDEDKVPISSIVILADHDCYQKLVGQELGRWHLISDSSDVDTLRVFLVEDFKGLESNVVFYYHEETTPENYNYVAYTRAKYYLFEIVQK